MKLGRAGGVKAWDLLMAELKSDNPSVRRAAIQALRRCPDPRAVAPLMELLTGPNVDGADRALAGMTLGLIGSDEAVTALIDHATKAAKPISSVALGLGYTYDKRAIPALIKCAETDNDAIKGYAFTALARFGTREAVDCLASVYNQYDNTSRYQGHSAVRLAGAWNQSAVDRFVEVVKTGGKIAPHGLEMAEDPRAVDALIDALPKSRGDRRQWIIESLGRIGDPKAVPALATVMSGDASPDTQYQAMRALRWRWYWPRPDVLAAMKEHPVFKAFTVPPPSLEEQSENTWVLRQWPADNDDDRVCSTTYEAGLEFDGSTGKVLKWGSHGLRCDSPQTGDTWVYDPAANTWKESASPVHPFGMCGTWGIVYDKANQKIVSLQAEGGHHGWEWDRGRAMRASSPWVYDGKRDRWTPVKQNETGYGPGARGFLKLAYHDRAQVVVLHGGQWGNFSKGEDADRAWVYDTYANEWTMLPASNPLPGARAHHGVCYLPELNKVLLVGGSYGKKDKRTWLFDLESDFWKDAQPKGAIPEFRLPVLYDPPTRTALHIESETDGARVWQYDPAANEWQKTPPASGPTPHHGSTDVTYDPVHNIYVLDGGHLNWNTDHIGVRELWTYRFRRRAPVASDGLPPPVELRAVVKSGGSVALEWKPVAGAAGYLVYRGTGPTPWQAILQQAGAGPVRATVYQETLNMTGEAPGPTVYYAVAAVDDKGREGTRSLVVRTQPPLVEGVTASSLADRTVQVRWDKSAAPDVAGYHVYASHVTVGDMHFRTLFQKIHPLQRLTDKPIQAMEFIDSRKLGDAEKQFNHEVRAYEVRAVNAWGVESGPSATVLNLTSSVPGVRATPQPDGTVLVEWAASPEKDIVGYRVYRMDEYRTTFALPVNPLPVRETRLADRPEFPRSERQAYYVVALDALGEEGMPSTGAFSFGRP